MFTQGNQRGPQKPMSSPYQQCQPGQPLPRPPFQQNPSGFTSYQHGPTAPNQIPPGGLENTGQSYLNPAVHVHGGASFPPLLPTAQQNSQYHYHSGTQNAHNMLQPVRLISASHSGVSQSLPPFRALHVPPHPPQSQVQTFYRAPVNPPLQPGLQHVSSHPPFPPTTNFFTSAELGGFTYSTGGDHHMLSTSPFPPLPPSSSAPPPPLSTSTSFSSSKPAANASNMPFNLNSDGSKLSASGPVDEDVASKNVKHNLIVDNWSVNMGGGNSSGMGSLVGDKISLQDGLSVDLSSSPPKPTNENVVERIKALCQSIAKNGPDYEDMVRKNESGKPEYAFLYGGEPGSEAAIAHGFFQWMKNKSSMACKLDQQKGISNFRLSQNESSKQPCHLVIAAASHSSDDSDLEMEDDITQIDDDQGMNHSLKVLNSRCGTRDNILHVQGLLHPLQNSTDILFEKTSAACSSKVGEPEGVSDVEQMTFGASISEVNLVKSAVPTEQPVVTSSEKSNDSGQLAKGGSPIRLLQGYASDGNSDKDVETDVENTKVSFGANLGTESGCNLDNASSSRQTEKGFGPLSLSSTPSAAGSSELVDGTFTASIIKGNELADNKHVDQLCANQVYSGDVLQKQNIMVGASDDDGVKFSEERRQEEENVTECFQHKVDKFGRLLRNGTSDSESDDLCYFGRHRKGRIRSISHSLSPPDRRKQRSPRRRKKRSLSRRNRRSNSRSPRNRKRRSRSPRNRRSRSRSPRNRRSRSRSPRNRRSRSSSPRNRRSMSRSPSYQRVEKFSGENKKGVKGQMPFCFDFRRGRCYRGMSCRYLHHDYGKSDESRQPRSKQHYMKFSQSSRSDACAEIKQISVEVGDHDHGEARGSEVKLYGDYVTSRDGNTDQQREDSVGGYTHNQDIQSTEHHMLKSEKSRDIPASVFATHLVDNKQGGPNLVLHKNSQEAVAESPHTSTVDASSVGNIDTLRSCGNASQKIPTYSAQKSLYDPLDPMHQNSVCLPQQSDNSSISGSSLHKTSTSSPYRLLESNLAKPMELRSHHSHMASPSLPNSHGIVNPHMKQQQFLFRSSGESFPSYMFHNQPSYFALQPNSSLTSLPPPPLPPQDSTITSGFSSHIQQVHLPPRNDFGSQIIPRPYPTELSAHFQSLQQAYIQEANQPFLHASLPVLNLPTQHFGAPSMSGNDSLTQPTMQNVVASNSFAQGNAHLHAMSFSQQFLGSTSSTFPNPHASMLEKAINSKDSYDVMQEKDATYNKAHAILTRPPVDGRGIGSQYTTSSPNSARAIGQNFPRTGGDQYDLIFDGIEPSTRLSKELDYSPKLEVTGEFDILLGRSGSNKPLDMGENNERKDGGAVASAASTDNEEFGETAGAEVAAIENGSRSNPAEINMATGDIEIDQMKSPGKSKKSKDSRSMKLFKVALADFVKGVLKPSWQQGNMSKEAFKTIVRKTVDKVSGAMKSHRMPKSRAKIDQYIESSQRKLTKLVMGYVDKYVNV